MKITLLVSDCLTVVFIIEEEVESLRGQALSVEKVGVVGSTADTADGGLALEGVNILADGRVEANDGV